MQPFPKSFLIWKHLGDCPTSTTSQTTPHWIFWDVAAQLFLDASVLATHNSKSHLIVECGIWEVGWHRNHRSIFWDLKFTGHNCLEMILNLRNNGTQNIVPGQMDIVQPSGHQLYPFSSSSTVVICPRQHVRNRTSHVHTIQKHRVSRCH